MLLCSYLWVVIGINLILRDIDGTPGIQLLYEYIPFPLRVALWIGPGLLSLTLAWSRQWDYIALAALAIAPLLRIVSVLASWGVHLAGGNGIPNGWYATSLYGAMLGLVIFLASIRRPSGKARGGAEDE